MSDTPRFSIVIPTYNRATSIMETLDSCFAQKFLNLEIVVVDDGSSDDSLSVLNGVTHNRTLARQRLAIPACKKPLVNTLRF